MNLAAGFGSGSFDSHTTLASSTGRPGKRRRMDSGSEVVDVSDTVEHEQGTHIDYGKGLIISILGDEDDDGPCIWDALHASRIDDPFSAPEVTSPIHPESFSRARTLASSFPSLDEALRLCDRGFHTCYRLHETIKREELRQNVAILYDTSQEKAGFPYLDQCSLLAAVIGLAYALEAESHKVVGCGRALSKGLYYIRFAHSHLNIVEDSVATITQLRTVVSITLFQLFTSNAWLALPFLSFACKTTVNLGLHARFSNDSTRSSDEDTPMQNLYWTVLYLDAYISGLLGQKPFFDISGVKKATLAVMQHVAKNTSGIVRSPQELLFNVGLALSLELFDIQKRVAGLHLHDLNSKSQRDAVIEDIRSLETELDDFKAVCDAIFPSGEVVNVVARTRFELLMGFCVACLLLATQRRQLMQKSRLAFISRNNGANAKRYSRDAAALLAIDTASEYMKLPEHAPFSEPAAYSLFVCTLSLTASMSATTAGKERLHFATKVFEGFFLMTRIACPSFAGTPIYLHYIYKLGNRCGAIPGTGENTEDGPPVASPIPIENEGLLRMPILHELPQAQVIPASALPLRSDRLMSPTSTNIPTRVAPTRNPSSYQTSQSSAPPSLFSPQSSMTSESTPTSSARITPFNERQLPSISSYLSPQNPDRKGKKPLPATGKPSNR